MEKINIERESDFESTANEKIKHELSELKGKLESIVSAPDGKRKRRTQLTSDELNEIIRLSKEINDKKDELQKLRRSEIEAAIKETRRKKLIAEKNRIKKENAVKRKIENHLKVFIGGWMLACLRDGGLTKAIKDPDGETKHVPDEELLKNIERRIRAAAAGQNSYDGDCLKVLFESYDNHRQEKKTNPEAEYKPVQYPRRPVPKKENPPQDQESKNKADTSTG